jgi:hypothetical protein
MALSLDSIVEEMVAMVATLECADSEIAIAVKIDPVTENIVLVGRSRKTCILCTSVVKRQEIEDNAVDAHAVLSNVVQTLEVAESRPRTPATINQFRPRASGSC